MDSQLGAGTFSTVWLATHELTKINIAIKVIAKITIQDEGALTRLIRELNLMKQMHHPFIAEFYESLEDDEAYYYCMEFADHGNLLGFISLNGALSESQARHYFSQIISVLDYLHTDRHVCHRDVKAENMLLDRHNNIKVIDFGLSNQFTSTHPFLKTACGSPPYVAPEMVKGKPYSHAADIWSAGVLLYSMTTGRLPFQDDQIQILFIKIVSQEVIYPSFLSPALIGLLRGMLTKDPELRIAMPEIRDHDWFSESQYVAFFSIDLGRRATDVRVAPDIVQQIRDMGIETASIRQQLLVGASTELTAMYRMIRREQLTNEIRDLIAGLPAYGDPVHGLDDADMPCSLLPVRARASAVPFISSRRGTLAGIRRSPAPMQLLPRRYARPLATPRPIPASEAE
jgi:serine/threonine protein kinase